MTLLRSDALAVDEPIEQIVAENVRGAEDQPALPPQLGSRLGQVLAGQHHGVSVGAEADAVAARADLLLHLVEVRVGVGVRVRVRFRVRVGAGVRARAGVRLPFLPAVGWAP